MNKEEIELATTRIVECVESCGLNKSGRQELLKLFLSVLFVGVGFGIKKHADSSIVGSLNEDLHAMRDETMKN